MLSIDRLSVSYGKKTVLSDLSVTFDTARIHGIVGYNGAGKTTLLNALYGLPRKYEEISFCGGQLNRTSVSYLDMDLFFYPFITGRDYLKLFQARNAGFDYATLCEAFNVPIDSYIDTYSSGMKKKIAIIGILSMDKDLVLLDEPFNGLDMESVAVLQLALKKIAAKGKTILVTSHILESLAPICDTISLLQEGIIQKTFYPEEYARLCEHITRDVSEKYDALLTEAFEQ